MFCYDGRRGKFPAFSLTAGRCALRCGHCRGKLLETMVPTETPAALLAAGRAARADGAVGCLISGGLDADGTLPLATFLPAIKGLKEETGLLVTVHCGMADEETARGLKAAGVDQALIDVAGDDGTLARVYGGALTVARTVRTLAALTAAGLAVVPHVVVGLDGGRIVGEYRALEIIKRFPVAGVVIVGLMPLPGTPMAAVKTPRPEEFARLFTRARLAMPEVPLALGCARRRGDAGVDVWAVKCGVNSIAIPADAAVAWARDLGLEITWQDSCCSLPPFAAAA